MTFFAICSIMLWYFAFGGFVLFQQHNIKIITAIENTDYLKKVAGNIAQISNASMVASSRCSTDILELCKILSPDILICDLSDEGGNMNTVIKEICNIKKPSVKVIATASSKCGEAFMSDSIKNGADLFMENLDNPDILRSTLRIISSRSNVTYDQTNYNLFYTQEIDELLHKFKLPVHYNGYYYLRSAILKTAMRENKLPDVSCRLYEKIANEFNSNARQIERAVLKSVNYINKVCTKEYILDVILGYRVDTTNYSLNAKELIALIADQLRLKQNY